MAAPRISGDVSQRLKRGDVNVFKKAECSLKTENGDVKKDCFLVASDDLPEGLFNKCKCRFIIQTGLSYYYLDRADKEIGANYLQWNGFIQKGDKWYYINIIDDDLNGIADESEMEFSDFDFNGQPFYDLRSNVGGEFSFLIDDAQKAYTSALKAAGLISD